MNKKHFLLYWMQNFSSFISYTGFLTPFKVKTWFFYSINARYYLWEENNNAKMSRSIKILDVPKTFQFSFFFTPVCVYFQKISMARNAIFFYSSAEFSNCVIHAEKRDKHEKRIIKSHIQIVWWNSPCMPVNIDNLTDNWSAMQLKKQIFTKH